MFNDLLEFIMEWLADISSFFCRFTSGQFLVQCFCRRGQLLHILCPLLGFEIQLFSQRLQIIG